MKAGIEQRLHGFYHCHCPSIPYFKFIPDAKGFL